MNEKDFREELVGIGRKCGLQRADADDAAQVAMSGMHRAASDPENYARKTVRNLAKKLRTRPSRSASISDDIAAADASPDLPSDLRQLAMEHLRTAARIDAAIEHIVFWGLDGGSTVRLPMDAPEERTAAVLTELRYYEYVLAALPVYTDRHRRNLRSHLLDAIRAVVARPPQSAVPTDVASAPASVPVERPQRDAAPGGTVSMSDDQSIEATDGCVMAMLFPMRATVATDDGDCIMPLTMLWFGTWSEYWAREVTTAELAALSWPEPGEVRVVTIDGINVCVLGDLLWRGVELARRLAPRATQEMALRTSIDAYRATVGTFAAFDS